MPPLEAVKAFGLNHDVYELVEQRETIKVETQRPEQSTFRRNRPETPKTSVFQLKIHKHMVNMLHKL